MEGTLDGAGVTPVLQQFRSEKQTGVLHVLRGGATKHVYFDRGDIVFASSEVTDDRLGEMLVRRGKLSRDELERACQILQSTHTRLGRALVDLGYLSEPDLDAQVKAQIEAILSSLFDWQTGAYRADLGSLPVDADLLRRDIVPEPLLLQAGRRIVDADAIRARIGDLGATLVFERDPVWVGKNLSLTPEEGFVMSRVDGSSTADEIAQLSPLGERETLQCIAALLASGVLATRPDPSASVISSPTSAVDGAAKPRTNVQRPPQAPPTRTPEALAEEVREFHETMQRKYATAHQVTYYELLEVSPTASAETIRSAYLSLAKKLHPDYRSNRKIEDPEGLYNDLYLAIEAAYEVLSSPSERRRYDSSMEMRSAFARPLEPQQLSMPKAAPTPDALNSRKMAGVYFSHGQRFYDEGRYHEAIEQLQNAVRLDDTKAEYHRLLGHALVKNPHWKRRAEKHYIAVLERDRFDVDTMLALAGLYEEGGMALRARKLYEEVLTIDPENETALDKGGGRMRGSPVGKLRGLLHRGRET